jgi:hypothetical protein
MLKTYDMLVVEKLANGHCTVGLALKKPATG